jgi:transcriptional regulator with XRE-family HTH domain
MRIQILLKEVREERNISLRRLSQITGMSPGHLSRIENGETMPTILSIERIAIALRVKSNELYKVIP